MLLPEAISDPGVAEPERAQWRLAGEDDTMWRDSGVVLEGLVPGSYLIECKEIAGRDEPKPSSVLVADGETGLVTLTYSLESVRSGAGPEVLDFATVSAGTAWPYGWVGQLRSNAGLATGTVVKPRVVLTAGHVVFDDGTLSPAVGLEWMHQRDRGAFEPAPQEPRGYYLFTGYAAQREAEDTPGVSSPQSQNLDVATLYFPEDAGRGGYSGFLASDLPENEFLMSDADKTLVGYPVDGIAAAGRGRMHATPVMDVEFTPGFGRTYSTEDIWSVGGNSGGPLCVQHEGGSYYPAAVYLGGTGQTVVRAIDSEVIDLIGRAEVSGGGGENNTGGGITHTTTTKFGPSGAPGALKVTLSPSAARSAGARWRLGSGSWRRSGDQLAGLRAGTYTMRLSTVDGYESPSSQAVKINGGQLRTVVFTYEEEAPTVTRLEAWRLANYGSTSNSGSGGDRANGDGDEFDNVAEWGFGLDPHAPDGNPVSATVNEAGNVEVTLPQLEVRGPPSYEIWVSENQSSWVMVNPELDVRSIVDVPGPTEMVTYEYTGTMGADGKLFVRVRIRE